MSAKYAFTKSLKEIRFLFCHSSPHSEPVRTFLQRAYPTMKKNNPHVPIMMREATGTEPRIFTRYEFGKEKQELLSGLTDKEIEQRVTTLVKNEAQ
ncbi:hypothetical protein FQN54_008723 [Arachnomyces sp. PD_36]|nr:hypothetical protein FQN54_008723 [Arachnomyces sp. PD_36]